MALEHDAVADPGRLGDYDLDPRHHVSEHIVRRHAENDADEAGRRKDGSGLVVEQADLFNRRPLQPQEQWTRARR